MVAGYGEMAALGTAVVWGASNQIQSAVGQRIGANSVTLLRLPYQFALLGLMCLLLGADTALPPQSFALLLLSGFAGITLCDFMLYRAIYIIGPTMSVLLQSLSAGFAAVFGRVFLDEVLPVSAWLGIGITLAGVGWVVTEKSGSTLLPGMAVACGRTLAKGIALGLGTALVLALSFTFLKLALGTGVDPLWATFVRMVCGALVLWGFGLLKGWAGTAVCSVRDNPHLLWILLISCSCGAGGMWLSSIGMRLAPVGVVSTLIGLQPIMVAMIGSVWYRRLPSWRIVLGSFVAFGGTALVCMR